ncbi:MAG TPA: molybdenum cofactor synthesis domain-containing protein [Actinomycetota bacterium]
MSASGERAYPAAVVTVSDGVSRGVRDDASGRAVAALLEEAGFEVLRREVVADERPAIEALLSALAGEHVALVATTGGTGLGPRDVTPEATRAVIEREAPGLAEEMRAAGRASTPMAALSRGVAGSRGRTLILNLPGSARGATESLQAVLPVLSHALDLLAGDTAHGPGEGGTAPGVPEPPAAGADPVDVEHLRRRAAGMPVVLATAVGAHGAPPCRVGQKMLLGPDGPLAGTLGCAEFDAAALVAAKQALAAGEPSTVTFDHDLGAIDVFVEPTAGSPMLILVSATPVSAALARWGREVGFDPIVVEPRTERLAGFGAPAARVETALPDLPSGAEVYAIHTDHDAPGVADSVAALLRAGAAFVGVMGSARHVGPHVEQLRAMGFGDDDLARVRTPVGLDIGARSAEEIALSMLAGVVAARRGRDGGWLDRR